MVQCAYVSIKDHDVYYYHITTILLTTIFLRDRREGLHCRGSVNLVDDCLDNIAFASGTYKG